MRTKFMIATTIISGCLLLVSFIFLYFATAFFYVSKSQISHYTDNDNYFEAEYVLTDRLYFSSKNNSSTAALWDKAKEYVDNTTFWQDVKVGETVTIVISDRVFWDGYDFPIVELRTEDKTYLSKELGIEFLIEELTQMRNFYLKITTPPFILIIISLALVAIFLPLSIIQYKKDYKKQINDILAKFDT